jgi:Uma2 family endonuclease
MMEVTMALAALKQPVDPDAFLEWEQRQAERYELVAGEARMMVGGSIGHNDITDNIQAALRSRLRGTPCRPRSVQTRVRCSDESFTYPDVVVSCSPRRSDELFIDDPVLVVEVLSPSTAQYDQGEKRWVYQAIGTLRQLVFVSPREAKIELVTRQADDSWRSVFFTGLDATLPLESLDLMLPMAEIYADTAVAGKAEDTGT